MISLNVTLFSIEMLKVDSLSQVFLSKYFFLAPGSRLSFVYSRSSLLHTELSRKHGDVNLYEIMGLEPDVSSMAIKKLVL